VAGSLVAGFYLLRLFDTAIATYAAAALNATVAIVALAVASRVPYQPLTSPSASVARDRWAVYVAIAVSGMTALAAQVIWTRLLSLMLGATVYTFSLIVAVFLAGLGIGSSLGAVAARTTARPRTAFALCQLGLCAAMAWAAYVLMQSLPFWPINPSIDTEPWLQFQLDLLRCAYAVLPGAVLWGASFPLALASVASEREDPARLVGGVYAANTLGAIVGALAASLLLVVWLGSQHAQQVLIALSGLSALVLFSRSARRKSSTWAKDGTRRSPCRSGRAGSATTTMPARSRRRASRRTCGCSGCSGT
jgi:spermidine synthase